MSGPTRKVAGRFWHQGYIIGKDAQGRDCLRFLTYSVALRVVEAAAKNRFRLAVYADQGDWCVRLLKRGETQ
jgi:hypothetical protein